MKSLLLIAMAIGLAGCTLTKPTDYDGKKRTITLYASDGHVIQTWTPDSCDSFNEGWAMFRVNGKVVKVTGTMVSEVK